MLEQSDLKIPSHAKDIIMSIDPVVSEGAQNNSSGLSASSAKSQGCMKSQLNGPKYLEKRRKSVDSGTHKQRKSGKYNRSISSSDVASKRCSVELPYQKNKHREKKMESFFSQRRASVDNRISRDNLFRLVPFHRSGAARNNPDRHSTCSSLAMSEANRIRRISRSLDGGEMLAIRPRASNLPSFATPCREQPSSIASQPSGNSAFESPRRFGGRCSPHLYEEISELVPPASYVNDPSMCKARLKLDLSRSDVTLGDQGGNNDFDNSKTPERYANVQRSGSFRYSRHSMPSPDKCGDYDSIFRELLDFDNGYGLKAGNQTGNCRKFPLLPGPSQAISKVGALHCNCQSPGETHDRCSSPADKTHSPSPGERYHQSEKVTDALERLSNLVTGRSNRTKSDGRAMRGKTKLKNAGVKEDWDVGRRSSNGHVPDSRLGAPLSPVMEPDYAVPRNRSTFDQPPRAEEVYELLADLDLECRTGDEGDSAIFSDEEFDWIMGQARLSGISQSANSEPGSTQPSLDRNGSLVGMKPLAERIRDLQLQSCRQASEAAANGSRISVPRRMTNSMHSHTTVKAAVLKLEQNS